VRLRHAVPTRRSSDLDSDADVRVLRRLSRDIKERGRDFDGVVEQYFRTVRPMHYGFVEPSKRYADIIIPHGGNNEIAIEMVAGRTEEHTSELQSPDQL